METIGYGVIRLPVVPVRSKPADAAEMTSQLLFGENYRMLELSDDKKWCYILNVADDYTGWIDAKQHHEISREFFDQITNTEYQVSTDLLGQVSYQGKVMQVSFGTVLPLLSNPLFAAEEKIKFSGSSKAMFEKLNIVEVLEQAMKWLNVPYLWGGKSVMGIDCSGFTQLVFKVSGYLIPRDSSQQILKGKEVPFEGRNKGDLMFFTNQSGKMNHVGLYIGEDQIIHASGCVRIDVVNESGIFNSEQNAYTHNYFKTKRILK